MIPILITFGLIFGRWWRTTLAVGVGSWVVALLAADVIGAASVPAAGALALLNTGAGALVHQAALAGVRSLRHGGQHPRQA